MSKIEYKFQLRAFIKLLWVCGFALLYALGGIEYKFLRRFIAPLWLTSGMFLFSRDWRVFLQAPLLMFSLSLGYGASEFWIKMGRRLIFGLANGFTNITHLFDESFDKKRFWTLFILSITILPILVAIFGVINPVNARAEELLIGFFIGVWPIFMVERKNPETDGKGYIRD